MIPTGPAFRPPLQLPSHWEWIHALNASPFLAAATMLIINLGGRHLAMDISDTQEKFLTHPITRRLILFAVMFMATRNVLFALILTVIITFVFFNLLHEESPLYMGAGASNAKPFAAGIVHPDLPGLGTMTGEVMTPVGLLA